MNTAFNRRKWFILILFGLIGQIAWSVENMYFNLFVFDEIAPNLDAITLMVQLSGVCATLVTLIAGTLSDKLGNRRSFISIGYIIWGVTVGLFGFISPSLFAGLFGLEESQAITVALGVVIVGDCFMTLFGSCANDAAFNAWVTDNTESSYRGKIESVLSIMPLASMLIVAGGFGILVSLLSYKIVFLAMGVIIVASGILGLFLVRDKEDLQPSGSFRDIIYGFKPSTVKGNPPLYITLLIVCIYGIACQTFMPYLIIYMKTELNFTELEYSAVFAIAIILGAAVNLFLGKLSDKLDKMKCMYLASAIFSVGLFLMYIFNGMEKLPTLILFGIAGFVMIVGFIFISALSGAIVRDYTPEKEAGKLQGVRMIFSVLIPMLAGPAIGNLINSTNGKVLENAGADAMTTSYVPAAEIFLAASIISLLILAVIPIAIKLRDKCKAKTESNDQ